MSESKRHTWKPMQRWDCLHFGGKLAGLVDLFTYYVILLGFSYGFQAHQLEFTSSLVFSSQFYQRVPPAFVVLTVLFSQKISNIIVGFEASTSLFHLCIWKSKAEMTRYSVRL